MIVIDIEANGLHNPTKVHVIVCKDIDKNETEVFRNLNDNPAEKARWLEYSRRDETWIGHNILGYDWPVLVKLLDTAWPDITSFVDTFILSRLIDYPRQGHSVESYGEEFNLPKGDFSDWSRYSLQMEEYCKRDVDITERIFRKYARYWSNPSHKPSIELEHQFQLVCNGLEANGFMIDLPRVKRLHEKVLSELSELDDQIQTAFPPKLKKIRTVTPKGTKYGTISLSSIPKSLRSSVADFSIDAPFDYCEWSPFNPGSPKQVVELLNSSGWKPEDKTTTHIDTEREIKHLERSRIGRDEVALTSLRAKLGQLKITGWKVNEVNLSTLPKSAPAPARLLARRILFESRRKTLQEWLDLVHDNGRIYGRFQGIGAWTHRMSHQKPNMANITNEHDNNGKVKILGKELRQCWTVPRDRLLVGVDAEGIQLRIFAHLVNDPELIQALVQGKKSDKTDPHSLNQRIIGSICKARSAAKRFIYALFLGAGLSKLAAILECTEEQAREALDRILQQYTGWQSLRESEIPRDAKRGWTVGLDGRRIRIPGETIGERRHLWMSGQLQSGEAIVIKTAAIIAEPQIKKLDAFFVDIVHDEYEVECPNDFQVAMEVAKILADAIKQAGEDLGVRCPLAGSYYNDDHKDYTIGRNWYDTH